MTIESISQQDSIAQSRGRSFLRLRDRRRPDELKIPSPGYCIVFLVLCITVVELGDGLIVHLLGPHLSHNGVVLVDILFMISVLVPGFYFFVYRPMKTYTCQRAEAEAEIRYLSRQLILNGDQERRTVAREVFEDLGQSLSVLQFSMATMKAGFNDQHLSQITQCENLIETIARLGSKVRDATKRIYPPQLEDLGLVPTIEWEIKGLLNAAREFTITFNSTLLNDNLSRDIELAVYLAFKEAMDNAIRYSQAKNIVVELSASTDLVSFILKDDGVGFDTKSIQRNSMMTPGIGLLGLRERAEALGGKLSLSSTPGKGVIVQLKLPKRMRRKDDHSISRTDIQL